ncbi:MAG: hypothetical protein HYX51_02355 [Chloroflexi bacterium]|nr:hypothetical protein [Chloroflexota bacterium]
MLRRVPRLTGEVVLATGTLQVYGVWISLYIVISRSLFAGRAGSPLPWLWLAPGVLACFLIAQLAALPTNRPRDQVTRLPARPAPERRIRGPARAAHDLMNGP